MELFEIANRKFYFDLDKLSDYIKLKEETDTVEDLLQEFTGDEEEKIKDPEYIEGQMIDISKWEITKAMIETVLSENSIVDEQMGVTKLGDQLSIPFRLAFNTLLHNNLIRENE